MTTGFRTILLCGLALMLDQTTYGQSTHSNKMEKTSVSSKLYRIVIRIKGIKKSIENEFKKGDHSKSHKAAEIPQKVMRECDVTHRSSATGRTVWELKKKGTVPKRQILFLHGGAFVRNMTKYDWLLLNKLAQQTNYGIVVPDYPLAPEYGYKDVFGMLVPLYEDLVQQIGGENLVLMGFSAGGGLTLSLAQYSKNKGVGQPGQIILLSPLLDATLQNPQIATLDKRDPYLGIEGLKLAVDAYSKGDDLNNYMISPINGPLQGLAPIHLFIGTHEILLPDARKLVALAEAKHVEIDYHEYYEMYHAWVFLNIPEAEDVFDKLMDILN